MSTTKPRSGEDTPPSSSGLTLADVGFIRNALYCMNTASSTYGISAAGTNQATATQLGSVLNEVDTVAGSTGVNLPYTGGKHDSPYQFCLVINNGANTLTVYAAQGQSDTINGTTGATGVTQVANSAVLYCSAQVGKWFALAGSSGSAGNFGALTATSISNSGNFTESTVGKGFIQKAGANARANTFTLNGATTVTVTNSTVATSDFIGISLNTLGGTQGAQPIVTSIQVGTSFTVLGTASDTSIYNYTMIGTN